MTNAGRTRHFRGSRDVEFQINLLDSLDSDAMYDLLYDETKTLIVGAEWGGGATATQAAERYFAAEMEVYDITTTAPVGVNITHAITLRLAGDYTRGRTA